MEHKTYSEIMTEIIYMSINGSFILKKLNVQTVIIFWHDHLYVFLHHTHLADTSKETYGNL